MKAIPLSTYLSRRCPCCDADRPADAVHSGPRAEALPFEALKPYWAGLFKKKVFFSYDRCGECGLLYAPTYFTPDQLAELYAEMAPNMEGVPGPALEATQRGYWEVARKAGPMDGGYLEIGPDIGYVVRLAAQVGRFDHFWLFEPNLAVHDALGSATLGRPHTISPEMEDLSIVRDGSVGLAVMIHVLDHLLDPRAMLAAVRAKLRPGGLLMIVTHNEKSLLRSAMALKWPPFCLQHPELYNPKSMTALLRRADFGSVRVERSRNHFPIAFMVRQAAFTLGIDLTRVPLPSSSIGLKLGNMLTLATR